jgi:hypothetical protein
MADKKDYTFRTTKSPDGALRYFVGDRELPDKDTYERIKAKANQIPDEAMDDQSSQFDATANQMSADFDKAAKGFAKGGSINLAGCKITTAKKNPRSPRF